MDIYLIIVVVLVALAISDLVVGVANDAVNFLNSAVGSKVAPMYVVLIIASLGVAIGATFSGGMMEIARKGMFHPDQFYFSEIMYIFLAVMITDIILLDAFNTMGLPTSTTVSIVFELLGAAVAVSAIKIYQHPTETLLNIGKYINSEKALAVVSAILLSVILAFVFGAIVQYISRLIFTFQYQKTLKYFGSVWGGLAITSITFFMLIKGIKGASFITPDWQKWISTHTWNIVIYSFVGWTVVLQILHWLFKVDIPKIIVLTGTFALAFAFAGNDLVNFIGVPLAGWDAYKIFSAVPGQNPDLFTMEGLKADIPSNGILLLLGGVVMVITLWFSKKARTVIATTVDLSRQSKGDERFGASVLSRSLVRSSLSMNRSITRWMPDSLIKKIDQRFEIPKTEKKKMKSKDAPAFDVIRASVNLVVASILIAGGTSLKLPLSTTYVTFMVAMGTSLSDRAWGRDSAVYRIQGVFLVIGGWFLTAIIAFSVAFIFASILYWGHMYAVVVMLILAIYFFYRTHVLHKSKQKEKLEEETENELITEIISGSHVFEKCQSHAIKTLGKIPGFYEILVKGLSDEDRALLNELRKEVKKYNRKIKKVKDNVNETVISLRADQIDTGHYYVQSVDYMREIAHCLNFMVSPGFEHIDNNHEGLGPEQKAELLTMKDGINILFKDIMVKIETRNFSDLSQVIGKQQELLALLGEFRKNQIKRINEREIQTRRSLLYLDILAETKNLLLYSINLLKSQRDFIVELQKK
jgi:phosphate/sulfate permease